MRATGERMHRYHVRSRALRLWHLAFWILLLAGPAAAQDYTLPPVLLVPGYGGFGSAFSSMKNYLVGQGYPAEFVRFIDLTPGDGPNQPAAELQIAPAVETLLTDVNAFLATTSYAGPPKTKVAILGWSMGAFSSRWYATQVAPERVERWIGLAGANHGTQCACDLSCGIPAATSNPSGLDDLCPPFATGAAQAMQLAMNGAPGGTVDETPYGRGSDGAGRTPVPPDATQAILYFALRASNETFILPNNSAELDGAGGAVVTLPLGSPAQETAAGNYLLPGDDHISIGISSTNAFALILAILQAPLPASGCGDAVIGVGESCDEGIANGTSASCCALDCTVKAPGTTCRPPAGVCDLAETCDGVQGACPADSGPVDSDSDAICDALDPCTNVGNGRDFVSPPKSKVLLAKINADATPGNDKLVVGGSFTLPSTTRFGDLDPSARGARLVLTTMQGDAVVDVTLPAGAYPGGIARGWTANGAATVWQYRDKTAAPISGILSLKIIDASHNALGGRLKVLLKGKNATYPVTAGNEPVTATVLLGDESDAAAGRCGESAYGASDCAFNSPQTKLLCRR